MSLGEFDPDWGLWGLALYSFLSATILPGGSEVALFMLLRQDAGLFGLALTAATIGNTLGGLFSWWCGRILPGQQRLTQIPHLALVQRWGSPALLLAWVPIVGDALCVAAGWLRLHWLPCSLFMAAGKLARYWFVAQQAIAN